MIIMILLLMIMIRLIMSFLIAIFVVFLLMKIHTLYPPSGSLILLLLLILLIYISLEVVYQKLSSVNISKSAGPDGWPPMVLKETADSISLPLHILFTKSINAGTLPVAWKQGHVTPIYKKGPRCLVQNYRPITLTSIIGKILESIIRDALLNKSL